MENGSPVFSFVSIRVTRRSMLGYGNGRSITPFTTLKTAVFAPIARVRVRTATTV